MYFPEPLVTPYVADGRLRLVLSDWASMGAGFHIYIFEQTPGADRAPTSDRPHSRAAADGIVNSMQIRARSGGEDKDLSSLQRGCAGFRKSHIALQENVNGKNVDWLE